MTPAQNEKLIQIVNDILVELYILPVVNKKSIGLIIAKLQDLEVEVKGKEIEI